RALAHAVASNGHTSRAVAIATAAAQRLEQASGLSTAAQQAVYGALLLRGAILAAEGEDRASALALVSEAEQTACRLEGDDNVYGTYFCARNVRLHQLSIAVRLGDAGQAVAHAAKVDPAEIRLRERRAAYYLDLAQAFTQWGKYQQAYQALLGGEHAAWQELALRPACQELLAEVLRRCPSSVQSGLRQLADQLGVAACVGRGCLTWWGVVPARTVRSPPWSTRHRRKAGGFSRSPTRLVWSSSMLPTWRPGLA